MFFSWRENFLWSMQQSIHRQPPLKTSCETGSSERPRTVPVVREGNQISRCESSHEGCAQWCVLFPSFTAKLVLSMPHHKKREVVYNKYYRILGMDLCTKDRSLSLLDSLWLVHKAISGRKWKIPKKIRQISKEIFAFAWCEWTWNIFVPNHKVRKWTVC